MMLGKYIVLWMILTLGAGAAVYWLALERPSLIVPPHVSATTEVSVSSRRLLLRGTLGTVRIDRGGPGGDARRPGSRSQQSRTARDRGRSRRYSDFGGRTGRRSRANIAARCWGSGNPGRDRDANSRARYSAEWFVFPGTDGGVYGVASQAGRPIAGAGVLALGEGIERKMTQPVRTSRTGEYRIEGLPPGSYRVLLLEENGMRTVRAKSIVLGAGEEHRLDFEYPRDASVSGTVSESGTGRPIRGARLSLSWKPGEELFGEVGPDAWVPLPLAKVTGSDGSYRLDRLIPGTYRIEVNHGGHQPAIREVMVDEGANAEDCEIRLSR